MRIDLVKLAQRVRGATQRDEGLETLGALLEPLRKPVVRGVWCGQGVGTKGTGLWVVRGSEQLVSADMQDSTPEWVLEQTFPDNAVADAEAFAKVQEWRKAGYEAMLLPLRYDDDQREGLGEGLGMLCALDAMMSKYRSWTPEGGGE